jgi:hypothetical protein
MKPTYIKASEIQPGDTIIWRGASSIKTKSFDYRSTLFVEIVMEVEEGELNETAVVILTGESLTPPGYIPQANNAEVKKQEGGNWEHPKGKVALPQDWQVLLIDRK